MKIPPNSIGLYILGDKTDEAKTPNSIGTVSVLLSFHSNIKDLSYFLSSLDNLTRIITINDILQWLKNPLDY